MPWLISLQNVLVLLVIPSRYDQTCSPMLTISQDGRWKGSFALDIITELSFFGVSTYLVLGLKMAYNLKAVVVCAFGVRLP